MNDINDKLIEGLEEAKQRIADLEDNVVEKTDKVAELENELEGNNVIYQMAMKSIQKVSIVNDMLESMNADVGPDKVILISEVMFAFVKTEGNVLGTQKIDDICLWSKSEDNDWCEVSDLTELRIWEYQEIKSYAVAVGMIKEEEDLFI